MSIPPQLWSFTERHQRFFKTKQCLATYDHSPCGGQIVRAHIIAVPTSLLATMRMQRTKFEATKIGIGEFSTMNCFCADHDKIIFAPIEDAPLASSSEQLALLHYRAVAAEFYQRRNQLESAACELNWESDEPQNSRFSWIFMWPQYDFAARRVQNLADECCYVAMHLLAADGTAFLAFTWLRSDSAAEWFVRTFAARPKEQMASLAVQCAFEHIEHTCMSDRWWSNLKRPMQAALVERVRRANSLAYRRSPRCLSYRIHYANWPVADIRQSQRSTRSMATW